MDFMISYVRTALKNSSEAMDYFLYEYKSALTGYTAVLKETPEKKFEFVEKSFL